MTILGLSSKLKLTAPRLEHLMLTEGVVCVWGGRGSFIKVGVLVLSRLQGSALPITEAHHPNTKAMPTDRVFVVCVSFLQSITNTGNKNSPLFTQAELQFCIHMKK